MKTKLGSGILAIAAALSVGCIKSAAEEVAVVRSALSSDVVVTVIGADSDPVVGIEVIAEDENGAHIAFADTDAGGQAVLGLEPGAYRFLVGAAGEMSFFLRSGEPGHCVVPTCTAASITVTEVVVFVADADGNPRADTQVFADDENDERVNSGHTDQTGHVTLGFPPGGYRFRTQDYPIDLVSGPLGHCQVPTCTEAEVVMTEVEVLVVDGDGNPLPDEQVLAEDSSGHFVSFDYTDAQGRTTVPVHQDAYHFAIRRGHTEVVSGPPLHCQVPACRQATIVVNEVQVTVVDAQGNPLPDRKVQAQYPNGGYETFMETDQNGIARLPVPPGAYRFITDVGEATFASGPHGHCLVPTCRTATIEVRPVTVSVFDTAEQPLANVEVFVVNENGTWFGPDLTNATGVVQLSLGAGSYQFVARIGASSFTSGPPGHCTSPTCQSAAITVPIPVTVTVLDAEGNPAPDADVVAEDTGGATVQVAETDALGVARLWLPNGPYRFHVDSCVRFYSGPVGHCEVPGCTEATIHFLPPVPVAVTDPEGHGRPNFLVLARNLAGDWSGSELTDANGIAYVKLEEGAYRFITQVGHSEFESGPPGHCVQPGCLGASIVVPNPVVVSVVDVAGQPLPGLEVVGRTADGITASYEVTDTLGHAPIWINQGSYFFNVKLDNTWYVSGPENHCVVPGCDTATITVMPPVFVQVVNQAGNPRADIEVVARTADGIARAYGNTGADGVTRLYVNEGAHFFTAQLGNTWFESGTTAHCNVPGCTSATIVIPDPVVVTVLDGAGVPKTNKEVVARSADGLARAYANTDSTGRATVWVTQGAYFFDTEIEDVRYQSGAPDHCVVPGCTSAAITVVPAVVVTVVYPDGTPVNNKMVYGDPAAFGSVVSATTDSQGKARLPMPVGQWRFYIECSSGQLIYSGAPSHCEVPGCEAAQIVKDCGGATGSCAGMANGTACNDGNACTQSDTCQNQQCVGGNPVTCTASDQCHDAGTCNPATGACSASLPKPNGSSCEDGNGCTEDDTCQAGACNAGSAVVCVAQDQCHTAGTCDPATGACSNPSMADGTACSDGNACTRTDTCQAGACNGGNPVTCLASDQCHNAGACNPATGACSAPPAKTNGTACDDGNSCTAGDTCQAGSCAPGSTGSCQALTVGAGVPINGVAVLFAGTLTKDKTSAVPGDPINFTTVVTNTGLNLTFGGIQAAVAIRNVSASPITLQGFKHTFEYFSLAQQAWVPFASHGRDNAGAVLAADLGVRAITGFVVNPITTPAGVTHSPQGPLFGTTLPANMTADAGWIYNYSLNLSPAEIAQLFGPGQAAGFRVVWRIDTSAVTGSPSAASASASITSNLTNVDGVILNPAVNVTIDTAAVTTGQLAAASNDPLAPGASRTFTGTIPVGTLPPRGAAEPETAYRTRLNNAKGFNYRVRALLTGQTARGGVPPLSVGTPDIDSLVPILTVTKTGPAQVQAGFTTQFGATLANSQGTATAGPFLLRDLVDGVPMLATFTIPGNLSPNASGAATIQYQVPIERPAGPMTDVVEVQWYDSNGNIYGPFSSGFTTSAQPGLFDGLIRLAGETGLYDAIGTTKLLTATVLSPSGTPVASQAVHLTITGPNARALDGTTAADGTVTFAYAGTNRGRDTAVATATIVANPVSSNAAHVEWVSSDGAPCAGGPAPVDIVLIIDNSGSMGVEGKLEAAKAGAKNFVDSLNLTRDQVGVVAFNPVGGVVSRLSRDATAIKQAIDRIFVPEWVGGSDVGAAIDTARVELLGLLRNPQATPVLVLLSDGVSASADPPAITTARYEQAIAAVKASSIPIRAISVALGSEIDIPHLRQLATSPSDYFYAPSASDVAWAYAKVGHDLCRNLPVLVRAGGDQGVYGVRLPLVLELQGEIHDDGPPEAVTSQWTQVSGPAVVSFADASSPVTSAVFTDPGTYVLELAASDGFTTSADRATITVDPEPSLAGANLAIALGSPGPLTTGTIEPVTATLTDGTGAPIRNFAVRLTVTGPNGTTAAAVTNTAGVASFSYRGAKPGVDTLYATALGSTVQVDSPSVTVQWTQPETGGPILTQGWIASPIHQSTLMERVPVVLSPTVTLASGTVSYWPASAPAEVHVLAAGVSGAPGATIATLDTTVLANGSYVLKLDGTDGAGNSKVSQVLVTVTGEYKPGRVVVEVTDFKVSLPGMPLVIGRRYDSLERDKVGDFGHGWSLTMSSPRLEVDPAYGVTITLPNGRRATFRFAPTFPVAGPVIFGFMLLPKYQAEPGVYGTLTADGCGLLTFDPFAQYPTPICFDSLFDPAHLQYAPTTYTYTDPYGTVYVMGASGELRSITDRQNNTLTFTPEGIVSNAGGFTMAFERDEAGRVTHITSPAIDALNNHVQYTYQYDAAGDLTTAVLPDNVQARYTYDATHRLLTTKDPRGNFARTSTYDAAGRLATDTDALANVTGYTYDLAARTTRITNPDTGLVVQVLDSRGLLLSETDPLGHTTSHTYDANRNEVTRTNALNETTTFTYDARGNQTSVTDGLGRTKTRMHDAFSQPVALLEPLGRTTTLEYTSSGSIARVSDNMGTRATITSSDHGLPLTVTDVAGQTMYLTYDPYGNLASATDRLGRVNKMQYDGLGRLTRQTDSRGGITRHAWNNRGTKESFFDPLNFWHRFTYDQNDNVVSEYFPGFPQVTVRTYDALDHVTRETYGDGKRVSYTRDFRGNKLTETDELNRVTTYTYDHAGQLTRTTFPDGTFTQRTYDLLGRVASTTNERGHTTTYEYEAGCGCSERLTRVTDPLGRTTVMTYDALGRKTSTTDPAGHTTSFAYDTRNHLIETTYHNGTHVTDQYDARGRHVSRTDQINAVTTFGYDDEDQLTSVTDALGKITKYAYDQAGNLTSVADANNRVTTYEYDLLGRKTRRTLPMGQTETFAYRLTPVVTSHVDFRGKATTFTYDARDRLLSRIPDPTLLGEITESYTYTATGRRANMIDASGTTTYAYDTRDRLLTKATLAGTLTYGYDPAGNLATVRSSNASGTSVDYAWDSANQLVSVTDNRLGGATTTAYTTTGRPQMVVNPNGVNATYAYDALDRVTSLGWRQGIASPFASTAYTFNNRGQRLTATRASGRTATYVYDAASRLTSETISGDPGGAGKNGAISYVLDNVGNRLSRSSAITAVPSASYGYNANDQLTSDTYDANGNTTGFGGNTFAYDFRDRLVNKNSGAVTLVYDCDGARVAKTVGGVTTKYLVDDLNPTGYSQVLEEVSASGAVQVRYTYGTSLVSQARLTGTPATSYYGYDAHGNVAFLTDATGAVTDTYEYDAWGILVASTGTTVNTRLYTGEELDPDLGLVNLRARHYAASRGRFLTLDPAMGTLTNPLTLNRYLYASDDPVDMVDPSGRVTMTEEQFIVMAVSATIAAISARYPMNIDETVCTVGWGGMGGVVMGTFSPLAGVLTIAIEEVACRIGY